jgi:hypothetical protein
MGAAWQMILRPHGNDCGQLLEDVKSARVELPLTVHHRPQYRQASNVSVI